MVCRCEDEGNCDRFHDRGSGSVTRLDVGLHAPYTRNPAMRVGTAMRIPGLLILLVACSHAPPPAAPRAAPVAPSKLSALVQDWLDHGREPTLSIVFGVTEGQARPIALELGVRIDEDYGGEVAATVTRAQLQRLVANRAVTDVRRNFAVGLSTDRLDGSILSWLQERPMFDTCQPTDGNATVFVEIDHAPTTAERTVLEHAGVLGEDEHVPFLVSTQLSRDGAIEIAREIPGVRISLMPCMQLYDS